MNDILDNPICNACPELKCRPNGPLCRQTQAFKLEMHRLEREQERERQLRVIRHDNAVSAMGFAKYDRRRKPASRVSGRHSLRLAKANG